MTSAWERILRGLGIVAIGGFLIAAATPASNIIGEKLAVTDALQPSGAIVVLGGGLKRAGVMQEESLRRAIRGIELYRQGLAPLLLLLGPARRDEPNLTEAEVRTRLARAMGVPPDNILEFSTALTTREESIRTADLLQQRKIKDIILVTESVHMRRAKLVFERAGFEVRPAVSADYAAVMRSPQDRLWLAIRIVEESAALIYYRLAGYI